MHVAMTGSGGFIGRHLSALLLGHGHRVGALHHAPGPAWAPLEALEGAEAVVHLAGEPVAQRWTSGARERIRSSRVEATRALVGQLARLQTPPRVLVCASAVGYYGDRGDELLDETAAPGTGFLSQVCQAWEEEALCATRLGTRVVVLRTGMVLGRGGVLERLAPLYRAGLGGRLGSGRQWMSWIHITDMAALAAWALETPDASGVFNAVAPGPVTNLEFTRTLAQCFKRPAMLLVPAPALRLVYGEISTMLLGSQRAIPRAALDSGFEFRHPALVESLSGLL